MKLIIVVVATLLTIASGRPNVIWPQNVVTVPPNCPGNQVWINGQCRDVWRKNQVQWPDNINYSELADAFRNNPISSDCNENQRIVNGKCQDVWTYEDNSPKNVITVPTNCPPGQVFVNGQCRDVWLRSGNAISNSENESVSDDEQSARNVISVPTQCPVGFKPDALGNCRPIFY